MPMIEPILVEVPNPAHPYGAKGGGEVNIVPPMAAIANAIDGAIHETAYFQPIRQGCEIFFIGKLEWG